MARKAIKLAQGVPQDARLMRYVRTALFGLTQREFGELLDHSHVTIYRWEMGDSPISRTSWLAIIGVMAVRGMRFELLAKFLAPTQSALSADDISA